MEPKWTNRHHHVKQKQPDEEAGMSLLWLVRILMLQIHKSFVLTAQKNPKTKQYSYCVIDDHILLSSWELPVGKLWSKEEQLHTFWFLHSHHQEQPDISATRIVHTSAALLVQIQIPGGNSGYE